MQLVQPVLTLLWSALLLGETVTPASIAAAAIVLACVVLTQRTRQAAPAKDQAGASSRDCTAAAPARAPWRRQLSSDSPRR